MSQRLYLVELLPCFRFGEENSIGRAAHFQLAASVFQNRQQAYDWARKTAPITANPFVGLNVSYRRLHEPHFQLWSEDTEEPATPLYVLRHQIRVFGLTPPPQSTEFMDGSLYIDWWNVMVPKMSDEQKTTLWKLLVSFPYRIVPVEME